MRDLRANWDLVVSRISTARRVCILSDFDGTLSPLVDRPELAELPPEIGKVLEKLAASRVILGVVSGRALDDLSRRVALPGIWYVGTHGYEIRLPSGEERRFYDAEDLRLLETLGRQLAETLAGIPGVILEPKGPVLAVHYRLVEEPRRYEVVREFQRAIQPHFRRIMMGRGKLVVEARVRGNCNKGTAVGFIRNELPVGTLVFYFGDDATDRDAFRALAGAGISVQVGAGDAEFADYSLPDPAAVLEVLERIARDGA